MVEGMYFFVQVHSLFPHVLFIFSQSPQANCMSFPVLASLAQDYISLPAGSATVERTFSAAADVCSSDPVSLATKTIECCVGSRLWIQEGVPLAHKYTKMNEAIKAFGGWKVKDGT